MNLNFSLHIHSSFDFLSILVLFMLPFQNNLFLGVGGFILIFLPVPAVVDVIVTSSIPLLTMCWDSNGRGNERERKDEGCVWLSEYVRACIFLLNLSNIENIWFLRREGLINPSSSLFFLPFHHFIFWISDSQRRKSLTLAFSFLSKFPYLDIQ